MFNRNYCHYINSRLSRQVFFLKNLEIAVHSACRADTRQAATPTFFVFVAETAVIRIRRAPQLQYTAGGGAFTLPPALRQVPAAFLPSSLLLTLLQCAGTRLNCRAPLRAA
jgi:hypothetical protein